METKTNAIYYNENSECESSFIPNSTLRPEYGTLFEHQGFYAILYKMYLFKKFDLQKEMDLLFDPTPLSDCDF